MHEDASLRGHFEQRYILHKGLDSFKTEPIKLFHRIRSAWSYNI